MRGNYRERFAIPYGMDPARLAFVMSFQIDIEKYNTTLRTVVGILHERFPNLPALEVLDLAQRIVRATAEPPKGSTKP